MSKRNRTEPRDDTRDEAEMAMAVCDALEHMIDHFGGATEEEEQAQDEAWTKCLQCNAALLRFIELRRQNWRADRP